MYSLCVCLFFIFSVKVRKNSSLRAQKDPEDKKGQRLIEKETMETGRVPEHFSSSPSFVIHFPSLMLCKSFVLQVKFSVYLQYLRSMGWWYVGFSFVFYFIQNVAVIGQNLWLSDWTDDSIEYFNTTYPNHIRDTRIGVFGALGLAQGIRWRETRFIRFFFKCF